MATVDTERLYATTDAAVWAEEFAKVRPDVDEGLMIGWFANAIETAKAHARTEVEQQIEKDLLRPYNEVRRLRAGDDDGR